MRPVPAKVELTASGTRWRDTVGLEEGGVTANTHRHDFCDTYYVIF